jgi:hypothetical protein
LTENALSSSGLKTALNPQELRVDREFAEYPPHAYNSGTSIELSRV